MMGANINRRTVDNIRAAGWHIQTEQNLSSDVVRLIEARPRMMSHDLNYSALKNSIFRVKNSSSKTEVCFLTIGPAD